MTRDLVLTVMSEDKPGVVETLADTITAHGGNWLESRMAHLAGKFAGILRVSVSDDNAGSLQAALACLDQRGLKINVECAEDCAGLQVQPKPGKTLKFSIIGTDHPGIVHEIARAISSRAINMEYLNTDCSSTPWSGEPLFEASGLLQVPGDVDIDELHEQLEAIADELAVDIKLEKPDTLPGSPTSPFK